MCEGRRGWKKEVHGDNKPAVRGPEEHMLSRKKTLELFIHTSASALCSMYLQLKSKVFIHLA